MGGNNVGYRTVLEDYPDLLIDPNDPITFAGRIQYYLEHPESRLLAAKWASEFVQQFDVEHVGKQILKLYRS